MNHHRLNALNFNIFTGIPKVAGIYKIIALDDKGKPIAFNRFLGTDTNGILYIGKAENLYIRLGNMKRAFSSSHKSKNHIAVRRYNSLNEIDNRMLDKFPIERLVIEIETCNDSLSASELKKNTFKLYEDAFGERPPLNRQ